MDVPNWNSYLEKCPRVLMEHLYACIGIADYQGADSRAKTGSAIFLFLMTWDVTCIQGVEKHAKTGSAALHYNL